MADVVALKTVNPKWEKRLHVVKLDAYGYPGHSLLIWINFPLAVKRELFAVRGEDNILEFMLEHGVLHSCTLDPDVAQLPWDVCSVAVEAMSTEVTRINSGIFAPAAAEPAAPAAPKAEDQTG